MLPVSNTQALSHPMTVSSTCSHGSHDVKPTSKASGSDVWNDIRTGGAGRSTATGGWRTRSQASVGGKGKKASQNNMARVGCVLYVFCTKFTAAYKKCSSTMGVRKKLRGFVSMNTVLAEKSRCMGRRATRFFFLVRSTKFTDAIVR